MKRLWVAAIIFAFLIVLCGIGVHSTETITQDMEQKITDARRAAEAGNREQAYILSTEAFESWHEYHHVLYMYITHSKLEAVDQILAGLPSLIKYGADDQFFSECDRGLMQIQYLTDSELPNIRNIL